MSARVTAAERAALPVARAALEGPGSAYGMADSIVFALGGAQLLQSPETAAETEQVRAELEQVQRTYTFDTAELKRRVDELGTERHSTNEALDEAVRALRTKDARIAELEADANRLKRVAEREHKAFLDTHNALNLLREDANRVMAEHGVQAQQAELERVREQAAKFREQRGEWARKARAAETRVAELERHAAADVTVYRASHDSIVIGHYTTAAAAREHCQAYVEREHHGKGELRLRWREDEDTVDQPEEGPAELIERIGAGPVNPTGYLVIPVSVAAAYDPDGDE